VELLKLRKNENSRSPRWKCEKALIMCSYFHCGSSITARALLQIASLAPNHHHCKIARGVIIKWLTARCWYSTMVNIVVLHRAASFEADHLNFCCAKLRSFFKTSDKNLLAKKILLRQKRCTKFEAFLRHLGTLKSSRPVARLKG